MDKADIIAEIKRTATANNGKPLGKIRFESETGIKPRDWYGRYWARWGDALIEAGFLPNAKQDAYPEEWIIEQLIEFMRELGRLPTDGEVRLRARQIATFPSHTLFRQRLGRKTQRIAKILEYCSTRDGYDDVSEICRVSAAEPEIKIVEQADGRAPTFGYVYLMKSGKHHKIGHSNAAGRREYELSIQLPERAITLHTIATDDPVGIEAYWHRRFESKRLNGEWFNLDAADIRAFKRRKFM
jgi:hypothetical protein